MKNKLTQEFIINGWLEKYHGITVKELCDKEPELAKSPDWYKKYAVTQAQHDEWYDWAIRLLAKQNKMSLMRTKHNFAFDYLNCAPSIKEADKS